jgi:hypothetical protein
MNLFFPSFSSWQLEGNKRSWEKQHNHEGVRKGALGHKGGWKRELLLLRKMGECGMASKEDKEKE